MAGTIVSGTYTSFVSLDNPATQRPVTVTGKITNASGQGIVGGPAFAWTVNNLGTIEGNGATSGFGIQLLGGGTVNNAVAGLITGYNDAILIERAPGTISNLSRIESTGIGSSGIYLAAGGQVTNGSASVTTALISGGSSHAIYVSAGTGYEFRHHQCDGAAHIKPPGWRQRHQRQQPLDQRPDQQYRQRHMPVR